MRGVFPSTLKLLTHPVVSAILGDGVIIIPTLQPENGSSEMKVGNLPKDTGLLHGQGGIPTYATWPSLQLATIQQQT